MSKEVSKMTVAELKSELTTRELDTTGLKSVLVDRLTEALETESTSEVGTKRSLEEEEVPAQDVAVKKMKVEGEDAASGELMETRLLIENHQAGTIIGKGGANVVQIRQDSQAFVSIRKNENPASTERVLVLKGTLERNCEAIKLISNLLVASQVARKQKQADEQGVANNTPAPDSQIKLLIHKFYAGAIIGKGGEVIKSIKADTGANVSLATEPLAGSTEKTATLTGTTDAVYEAAKRVLAQMQQNPIRGSAANIPYTPGAAVVQAQQQAFNPYGNMFGSPQQPSNNMYGSPQQPPQHGHFGQRGGPGSPQAPGPSKTEKIVIPTVCAGYVIGKGGSIIREMKAQSGANISLADPEPTAPGDRVVTVTGTGQSIQTAIYLIRQRVEAYAPPAGGAF